MKTYPARHKPEGPDLNPLEGGSNPIPRLGGTGRPMNGAFELFSVFKNG